MNPFEQAWGLIKGFRHKFGPVTHFHGVNNITREKPNDENYMEIGRDPNQHREVIESIRSKGLIPSEQHGAVFMSPLLEAHNYAGGGPLFGIRTEGLDLEEGHMVDAHQQPHTIVRDTIDPERLVLISPNTYHENVHYNAREHPESEDYVEPRNLPDGGLVDSFGRPRLTLKAMRQTEWGKQT